MTASSALAAPLGQPMMMPPSDGAANAMSSSMNPPATPTPTILQLAQLESEYITREA